MALFNLSQALNGLATANVTVRRPSATVFANNGTANNPTFTTFNNVRTAFENLRGDDLKRVPEGDRTRSWAKVWPQMELKIGDRIVHPTRGTYIVQTLDESQDEGGFTSAFVLKLGDGES